MKLKKQIKEQYSSQEEDTKPKCGCGNTEDPDGCCDGSHKKRKKKYTRKDLSNRIDIVLDTTDPKKPMIDRKATQAKIDIDKKVRALLEKYAYNDNQIAGMLMIPLERVKQIHKDWSNVSRKN